MEVTFVILRNFCVLAAILVLIRNISWAGALASIYFSGGEVTMWNRQHVTPEWTVRAGSVLIALVTLFAFAFAMFAHVVTWMHPAPFTMATACLSLVCLATLLIWRLLYFAKRPAMMIGSLVCLAALSILVEVAQ